MIEAVHRYDGYLVQSTGDGVFALFGAPVAHEDHRQRALYTALRIQEEMRRYSGRLREAGNVPVEARVGVNTGEVVVRSLATSNGQVEYAPADRAGGHRACREGSGRTGTRRVAPEIGAGQGALATDGRSGDLSGTIVR
jgi:hypothetical protein